MKYPITARGWLKMMIAIAEESAGGLKPDKRMTEEDWSILSGIVVDIQNELGENRELLEKFNLKYRG